MPEEEQTNEQQQDNEPINDMQEPEQPVVEDAEQEEPETEEQAEEPATPGKFSRFKAWYTVHKKLTIPATVIFILGIVFGVPASRYSVLGLVLKKDYVAYVIDAKSNLPVSEADVKYKGQDAKTGADGKATLKHVAVGPGTMTVTKKYYSDSVSIATVPLRSKTDYKVSLNPTGRQVPLKVVNKITGKPVAGVVLKVADTQVKTDEKGEATVVLPPEKDSQDGTLALAGYNDLKVSVKVSQLAIKENTFQITPAGKIYFLSKRTGQINVMKADLDGSNSTVILAATGNESDTETVLLASRDWQFLALKSRRDGPDAKLYLIETASDKLTEIDGGSGATIDLVGWSGHQLLYQLNRNKQIWETKRLAIKTYNADKKQLATIEESTAEGANSSDYAETELQGVTILADRVLYNVIWYSGYLGQNRLDGKKHAIVSVKPDGSGKQTLKDFDAKTFSYINAIQSEVGEVYYRVFSNSGTGFYTFSAGKVAEDKDLNDEKFNKPYPTFLISPTGDNTFWYESRDGKNTLFVGDGNGEHGNEVASLSDYTPYGWYSDDYILVSKNGSELFIMPSNGVGSTGQVIKVTDYHKPAANFNGYGYGYGGF